MQKDGYHEENKPIAVGNQKWEEAFGAADPRPPFNYCTQPVAQYHKQTCRKAKTFQSQKGIGQFKVWFYFVLVFVFTYSSKWYSGHPKKKQMARASSMNSAAQVRGFLKAS